MPWSVYINVVDLYQLKIFHIVANCNTGRVFHTSHSQGVNRCILRSSLVYNTLMYDHEIMNYSDLLLVQNGGVWCRNMKHRLIGTHHELNQRLLHKTYNRKFVWTKAHHSPWECLGGPGSALAPSLGHKSASDKARKIPWTGVAPGVQRETQILATPEKCIYQSPCPQTLLNWNFFLEKSGDQNTKRNGC